MNKYKIKEKLKILIIRFKFDSCKKSAQIQKILMNQIYRKKKVLLKMNIISKIKPPNASETNTVEAAVLKLLLFISVC